MVSSMRHKDHGDRDGDQGEEDQRHHLAGKHVGIKTNGEREDAGEMRDDLNGKHHPGNPPDGAQELLDVPETVLADSVVVVINPTHQG